jgi:lipoprotein-anchoring transpeptidase ErfK/SrfK
VSRSQISTLSSRAAVAHTAHKRGRRGAVLLGALLALIVLALAGLYAYDSSRSDLIVSGMRIGGVDVGGMSRAAAARKIQAELVAPLAAPVRVTLGGRSWQISGREAHVSVNVGALVAQALSVSRQGSFVSRGVRDLFGGRVDRNIPLGISSSDVAVRALTARIEAGVDRPAQDAAVTPSAAGLTTVPSRTGVKVRSVLLRAQIMRALTSLSAPRVLGVPLLTLHPSVSTAQLGARYSAYILVNRASFTLRFYDHLKLTNSYPIAVGMQGLETPGGLYHIQWEQVNPPWYVPNSAWAGSLAGTVVPPGPKDPLKARFMSFDGGAGIHGIDPSEYSTLGHNASHGCIRMTIPDVIDLYSKSPVGTPVYIL